ncbi:MAG TPA: translation elongation factor Ts [Thermomicrobiaceae bacterium]|nr:translation elongation factor Ts [Thermomicrobiaceae bacterium]
MTISTQMVKELREKTGAGIMDAKRALEATDGDMQKAAQVLRQKGLERADRKSDRVAAQGLVETYVHGNGRIGVMVEVNCETDFVARTPDFVTLAHDIAMQVAATDPRFVSIDEIPADVLAAGVKEYGDQESYAKQVVLLEQPFIKDPKQTIGGLIKDHIAKLGENVVVRRFARFELGKHVDRAEG